MNQNYYSSRIDKALAWHPRKRFQSAAQMREATQEILASLEAMIEAKEEEVEKEPYSVDERDQFLNRCVLPLFCKVVII